MSTTSAAGPARLLGIVGGMGPAAALRLAERIVARTHASRDQDHVPVLLYNNPRIPCRVASATGQGPSAVPAIVATARLLEAAGADLLLLPCNLAHVHLEELRREVATPFLDMIAVTAEHLGRWLGAGSAVGLLASTPTLESGLYRRHLDDHGLATLVPPPAGQKRVMAAIYGPDGVKAGGREVPLRLLGAAADALRHRGAAAVVAACSEVSVVLADRPDLVDPLDVLAGRAVEAVRHPGTPALEPNSPDPNALETTVETPP